jgi:hypothetical protein
MICGLIDDILEVKCGCSENDDEHRQLIMTARVKIIGSHL